MIEATIEYGTRHPHGWPCRIRICGQYEARQYVEQWQPTHLVSIKRRELAYRGPAFPAERHLLLEFEDVTDAAHLEAPSRAHLDAALAFIDALPNDASVLIHCLQGLSRSTALAFGLLAREVTPMRAAYLLHGLRPQATPNPLILKLWDARLGLQGELVRAGGHFPCQVWRHGDGLGNFPHRRKKGGS